MKIILVVIKQSFWMTNKKNTVSMRVLLAFNRKFLNFVAVYVYL